MSNNSYKNWDAMSDRAISAVIGDFIKHHRIDQNRTQDDVAQASGVSRSTLSLLERGKRVNISTLIQVMRVLDLLNHLNTFIIQQQISPLMLAEMDLNKRKRARKTKNTKDDSNQSQSYSDW